MRTRLQLFLSPDRHTTGLLDPAGVGFLARRLRGSMSVTGTGSAYSSRSRLESLALVQVGVRVWAEHSLSLSENELVMMLPSMLGASTKKVKLPLSVVMDTRPIKTADLPFSVPGMTG
jgi:hypothetical protein